MPSMRISVQGTRGSPHPGGRPRHALAMPREDDARAWAGHASRSSRSALSPSRFAPRGLLHFGSLLIVCHVAVELHGEGLPRRACRAALRPRACGPGRRAVGGGAAEPEVQVRLRLKGLSLDSSGGLCIVRSYAQASTSSTTTCTPSHGPGRRVIRGGGASQPEAGEKEAVGPGPGRLGLGDEGLDLPHDPLKEGLPALKEGRPQAAALLAT